MLLNAKKKGSDKMIKTFRGLLADGGQDRISLGTIQGKVGYKIVKFQLMIPSPGTSDNVQVVKIYTVSQSSIVDTIDLTESNLLAAGYAGDDDDPRGLGRVAVIFDNEIFNQDIFISHKAHSGSGGCNYYIELEVIPLSEQGAEYTTIKDLRANA